jgi:hypothetical protein
MHFTFSHYPVDFDETCRYRGDELGFHERRENEEGVLGEVECILSTLPHVLDKLRDLGLYDSATIVFKSDHGKPASYATEPPGNLAINGHYLGYDRYRPFLMIKPPDRREPELEVVDELVLLDDLARTLCRIVRKDASCEEFPGLDLNAEDLSSSGSYNLYVVKALSSDHQYDNHRVVRLPRDADLLVALDRDPSVELSPFQVE